MTMANGELTDREKIRLMHYTAEAMCHASFSFDDAEEFSWNSNRMRIKLKEVGIDLSILGETGPFGWSERQRIDVKKMLVEALTRAKPEDRKVIESVIQDGRPEPALSEKSKLVLLIGRYITFS